VTEVKTRFQSSRNASFRYTHSYLSKVYLVLALMSSVLGEFRGFLFLLTAILSLRIKIENIFAKPLDKVVLM
jgi:hypothetical protein